MTKKKKINVLFAAFEAVPFFKSGGLGDVAGTLPYYIASDECDIRVVLPKLAQIPEEYTKKMKYICNFKVFLGWREQYCGLFKLSLKGMTFYFLDNEFYFFRSRPYGEFDDGERIAFFSKAVLEAAQYMPGFFPDIIHCNDWHTALTPVFLREHYMGSEKYRGVKTIFTIHNIKFQGQYSDYLIGDILGLQGTPADNQLRRGDSVNYMQGGCCYADYLTTVSPSYADEICTSYYGEGLDWIFRNRRSSLCGILNGIDYAVYDPARDKHIDVNYDASAPESKIKNKLIMQKELGLEQNADIPMFVLISRLTEQKGLDLVTYILPEIVKRRMQLVVLGVGERGYEDAFSWYASGHPEHVRAILRFDEALSHRLYACADVVMVPSRFEPCGLTQMMAMRYGALALVRETGGLRDSVRAYNEYTGEGTGFSFANYNAHELLGAIDKALELYGEHPDIWRSLQLQAMNEDFSWSSSAKQYIALYKNIAGIGKTK